MYLFFSRALYFRTAVVLGILLFGAAGKGYGQRVYANTETHNKVQVLLVLAEVKNPGLAIDVTNTADFSTVSAYLGLLGLGTIWQNLHFGGDVLAKTPLIFKMGTGSTLLNILNNINVSATYNETNVGTAYTGTTLLGLLGGVENNEALFIPNVSFNGIKITINPIVNVATNADFYYAFYISPPLLTNQVICQDDPAILTVTNPQPNYTYKWYTVATGGVPLQDGPSTSYTTDPLSSIGSHYYYVEAIDHDTPGKSYPSARVPITVTVHPKPGTLEIHAE